MPAIFYFGAFLLFLISIRPNHEDIFLNKNSSNVIKGFFILLIVFTHIINAFSYSGFLSGGTSLFITLLGQLIVTMFFFISGYGIICSIDKNGEVYSKSLISNRVLRIILYCIVSLIPYFIYAAIISVNHPIEDYFLSFIGLRDFENERWFLFAILICYLISAIIFLINFKKQMISILFISVGISIYIFIMFFINRPFYEWNTIISFPIGMVVSHYREKINRLLNINKIWVSLLMLLCAGIVILTYFIFKNIGERSSLHIIQMILSNTFFVMFFVLLTKIFNLKSRILGFLGNASFSVFIMHRLVLIFFRDFVDLPLDWFKYLLLFTFAIIIGVPFYYLYKLLDKYITNPIVSFNRKLLIKQGQ